MEKVSRELTEIFTTEDQVRTACGSGRFNFHPRLNSGEINRPLSQAVLPVPSVVNQRRFTNGLSLIQNLHGLLIHFSA